ncbi:serine/threonine protein kinase, CMGC, CDC2/CDK sub [Tilletia horrida]|uniref:Serine/threonine protein kinase, CMGC, CDC2/CDK sub n=1 Tax=Tilletia horrida TaxID=155126 RepID=A0AAN6G7L5_9BASI|nr:serine/threonine protein kinase, CMGC, CDC2/CDK sub [Tilletia horrida]
MAEITTIQERANLEGWPTDADVGEDAIVRGLFQDPDSPSNDLLRVLARYPPPTASVEVRGVGPLGPATEFQLSLCAYSRLEALGVPSSRLVSLAQTALPELACHLLATIRGGEPSSYRVLLEDAEAIKYGRAFHPAAKAAKAVCTAVDEAIARNQRLLEEERRKHKEEISAEILRGWDQVREATASTARQVNAALHRRVEDAEIQAQNRCDEMAFSYAHEADLWRREKERLEEAHASAQARLRSVIADKDGQISKLIEVNSSNNAALQRANTAAQNAQMDRREETRSNDLKHALESVGTKVAEETAKAKEEMHVEQEAAVRQVKEALAVQVQDVKKVMESSFKQVMTELHAQHASELQRTKEAAEKAATQHASELERMKEAAKQHTDELQRRKEAAEEAAKELAAELKRTKEAAEGAAKQHAAELKQAKEAAELPLQKDIRSKRSQIADLEVEVAVLRNDLTSLAHLPQPRWTWSDKGRYVTRNGGPIGQGVHGTVYSAWDTYTGSVVAIKSSTYQTDGNPSSSTLRELQMLDQVRGNNVVPLLDILHRHQPNKRAEIGIVMPYMPFDLSGIIYHHSSISIDQAKSYARQMLAGLDSLHEDGIIHGDFKPANVLVGTNHNVLIADLGMAEHIDSPLPRRVICSRIYRAPEVLVRSARRTTAVDIWAFGVVLAELLNKQVPWTGKDAYETLCQIIAHTGATTPLWPTDEDWPGAFRGSDEESDTDPPPIGVKEFARCDRKLPRSLKTRYRSEEVQDLVQLRDNCLILDPALRPTAFKLQTHSAVSRDPARPPLKLAPLPGEFRASNVYGR